MKQITDSTFKNEIASADIALVMFSAPWAGPCAVARPGYEAVAARYGNQIAFGEFSLDDNPKIPEKYGVKGIPAFYLMRRGVPEVVKVGAVSEELLLELCQQALE
jgi:thioredoxin 1